MYYTFITKDISSEVISNGSTVSISPQLLKRTVKIIHSFMLKFKYKEKILLQLLLTITNNI